MKHTYGVSCVSTTSWTSYTKYFDTEEEAVEYARTLESRPNLGSVEVFESKKGVGE